MHCYYHLSIILEYFEWSFDSGRLHAGGASVVHGPAGLGPQKIQAVPYIRASARLRPGPGLSQ